MHFARQTLSDVKGSIFLRIFKAELSTGIGRTHENELTGNGRGLRLNADERSLALSRKTVLP